MQKVLNLEKHQEYFTNDIQLEQIRKKLKSIMQLDYENDYMFEIILAAALSIKLEYPVWIMIIAPPSNGKTELLNLLTEDKQFHLISGLSDKFLFSGHDVAAGGYMTREVGKEGILAFPDFTTVINQEFRRRKQIFNQLRIIHDGKAGLGTGIDKGDIKYWEGKVAVIACVTEAIHRMKDSESDLGDRFIYFNPIYRELENDSLIDFRQDLSERKKVQKIVKNFLLQRRKKLTQIEIMPVQKQFLIDVCKFIALARTPVIRDGKWREIIHVHKPEKIYRLLNSMEALFKCLLCVNEDEVRSRRIILQVALATIPTHRFEVINIIANSKTGRLNIDEITKATPFSRTQIVRIVDDLAAIKVLTCHESEDVSFYEYTFSSSFEEIWFTIMPDS